MKVKMRILIIGLIVAGLLPVLEAQEHKRNITSSVARQAVAEVSAFQQFPSDYRLARMGSVRSGGSFYHIFTTYLKDRIRWRTLVFANSGAYLGYYETQNEPVELERSGIVYPGSSYSVEFGDDAEGEFDSGDAHIINFSEKGPPDEVTFEKTVFTFVSSPKRVRPDMPGYRFMLVADRLADAINRGRYLRIRDDFSESARLKLSEERTKLAFSNLRMRLGKVERIDPPWLQTADTAIFPISFERDVLGLKMMLNDKNLITGLWILPYKTAFPDLGKHATAITLPCGGRWRVMWGGTTRETSKYFGSRSRTHAREFVIADRYGKTYQEEGRRNENYFAFGRPVVAPAAGKVIVVLDGVEDNRPGSPSPFAGFGNAVVIQHSTNEVSVIGHLMNRSIVVKVGDEVAIRQSVARCGNSGDSTQPSIYYHLQDSPEFHSATGYRPEFRHVLIWSHGRGRVDKEHVPMRGEYVEQHSLPLEK